MLVGYGDRLVPPLQQGLDWCRHLGLDPLRQELDKCLSVLHSLLVLRQSSIVELAAVPARWSRVVVGVKPEWVSLTVGQDIHDGNI